MAARNFTFHAKYKGKIATSRDFCHFFNVLIKQIFSAQFHYQVPNIFSVIKYFARLFLFFSCIKVTSYQLWKYIFKNPFKQIPPNKFILSFKIIWILAIWSVFQPVNIIKFETCENSLFRKRFIPVEIYKSHNALSKHFLVVS